MNPDAQLLWRGPRWTLAVLLACLGMIGPFSIDTYIPAFAGIAHSLQATPLQMQQTLSAYLFGFALLNLFHGALSDSFGRRPVVLVGVVGLVTSLAFVGLSKKFAEWFSLSQEPSVWISFVLSMLLLAFVMRRG